MLLHHTIPLPTPSGSTHPAPCSPAAQLPGPSLPAGTWSPGSAGHLRDAIYESGLRTLGCTCEVRDTEEVGTVLCLDPEAGGRGKGRQGGDKGVSERED